MQIPEPHTGAIAKPALLRLALTGGLALLVVASGISLTLTAFVTPKAPFIWEGDGAEWIMPDQPVGPETLVVAPGHERTATYSAPLDIESVPPSASARVRAIGTVELQVNERTYPLATAPGGCLKHTCVVDVADALGAGSNRIAVRVTRKDGIPLVRLALDAGTAHLKTGKGWQVEVTRSEGTTQERAIRADDTRPYLESASVPTPLQELVRHATLVGAMFLAGAAGFLLATRRPPPRWARALPWIALVAAATFWAHLYAAKAVDIPLSTGLDGPSHLRYIRFVAERGALPRASDCFSCYHPPLYYVTSAGLLRAFATEPDSESERRVVKLIPALAGLGMVWMSLLAARRIFPDDVSVAFFAVVAASTLPLNIYMSAYVSNEPFHAFLAAASLVSAIGVLLVERAQRRSLVWLTVLLALTILSKYTGLAIAAIVLPFVALKLFVVEGRSLGRVAATIGAMGIGVVLLGGGPYLRSWMYFGDPFVWNLDLPGGMSWWQPPSFHTPGYYLHFGQSLVHPYYSMFRSFWDGMYSSLWGEGLPPGANLLARRHAAWNYDFMSAGYLLALPATLLSICGFLGLVRGALRDDDGRRRVALALVVTLLYALSFSALQLSVRFPVWGAVRATYVLSLVVPIALCSAAGLAAFQRWLRAHAPVLVRALFYGWLTAFVGVQLLTYGG